MKRDITFFPSLMETYYNKSNHNILKNTNIQKVSELKNNVTKKLPFYNVTSIHNSNVPTISIIQRNSDVFKKRNSLNK